MFLASSDGKRLLGYPRQVLSIRKNYAVRYTEWGKNCKDFSEDYENSLDAEGNRKKNAKKELTKNKTYSGKMTMGAKKRMKMAMDIMAQVIEPYKTEMIKGKYKKTKGVGFITLTIPAEKKISGKWGNEKLLAPFIRHIRINYKVNFYVWKLEKQKRGQLHWHVIVDKYIPWVNLRYQWNKILDKNKLLENYKKEFGHNNPNSTDIHACYSKRGLLSYMLKYMSKGEKDSESVDGKVWGCATVLNCKEVNYFKLIGKEADDYLMKMAEKEISKEVDVNRDEWFTVYKMKGKKDASFYLSKIQREKYEEWKFKIRALAKELTEKEIRIWAKNETLKEWQP